MSTLGRAIALSSKVRGLCASWKTRFPSPRPSPQGEGAHFDRAETATEPWTIRGVADGSPSPWGEGWGEGDRRVRMHGILLSSYGLIAVLFSISALGGENTPPGEKVSYYRDVRPLLQANCQGCHQPAKAKGGYVMTDFK